MSGPEQRVHARIHVSTEIEVSSETSPPVKAELKDLSKGGARFQTRPGVALLAGAGEPLDLSLPSLDKGDIAVSAEVVRVDGPHDDRPTTYAVRFTNVAPSLRQQLLDLIEVLLLSTSGGGRRAHPRVARRIEIRFGQLPELRAILEDISEGGLAMTVSEPLVLHEEVDVALPDMTGGELLILHARIVNQRRIDRSGASAWSVGLEFGDMRPEARRCLEGLLVSVDEAIGDSLEGQPVGDDELDQAVGLSDAEPADADEHTEPVVRAERVEEEGGLTEPIAKAAMGGEPLDDRGDPGEEG